MTPDVIVSGKRFISLLKKRKWLRIVCVIPCVFAIVFFIYAITLKQEWFSENLYDESIIPFSLLFYVIALIAPVIIQFVYLLLSKPLDTEQAKIKEELLND